MTKQQKCSKISFVDVKTEIYAAMAELADAHGSGPCESNLMEVQVLLAAPEKRTFVYQKFVFFNEINFSDLKMFISVKCACGVREFTSFCVCTSQYFAI